MKLAFQICQNVHFLCLCIMCNALLTTSCVDCLASCYVSTVAYLLIIVYIYFFNQIAIFRRLCCPLLQIVELKLLPRHPTLHISFICSVPLFCARPACVRLQRSWRPIRFPVSAAAAVAAFWWALLAAAAAGLELRAARLLAGARQPLTQPADDRERRIPHSSLHVRSIGQCHCQRISFHLFHISPRRRSR